MSSYILSKTLFEQQVSSEQFVKIWVKWYNLASQLTIKLANILALR